MTRLTVLLILLGMGQAFALSSYAQSTTLNLNFKNAPLEEVLEEIEDQSEFFFLYNKDLIDVEQKVDVEEQNKKINEILDQLFEGKDIRYFLFDRQIVLSNHYGETGISGQGNMTVQQQPAVSGTVTDEGGEPLPGVTVVVKGTTQGTVTNADGNYSLTNISEDATLVFSFVGMRTQEVVVNEQSVVNVTLIQETIGIEEVVAIGYGTIRKSDLTGSVSSVSSEEINSLPVINVEESLKGRSAGVHVTQNSGEPGGRMQVRIRGNNSLAGGNQPLYVVDGFPLTGSIDFLNPANIASITILKDASATAIYGSRGANGVVIITSKSGKTGKGQILLDSYYGVQNILKKIDVMDANQFVTLANIYRSNQGLDPFPDLPQDGKVNTDWQDLVFRSAPIQSHTLSFQGGDENTTFYLSSNFFQQNGIVKNTGYERAALNMSLNQEINNWLAIDGMISFSRGETDSQSQSGMVSPVSYALTAAPVIAPYNDEGNLIDNKTYSFQDQENPLALLERKNHQQNNSLLANTGLDFSIMKGLTFKLLAGFEYGVNFNETYNPILFPGDRGGASERSLSNNSVLLENIINYNLDMGQAHQFDFTGGFTYQTNKSKSIGISVSGFNNNITENYDLGSATTINPPSSRLEEWTLLSWLGRANYNLKGKYLFTASVRADGSSRFGAGNKWAVFPSGAFAWRIIDEPFMDKVNFISDIKLRMSIGQTGNTAIAPYQSLDRLGTDRAVFNGNMELVGYRSVSLANPDLKWETTTQYDVGIEVEFLNGRFWLESDYYTKLTKDLLAATPLPSSVGYTSILRNIGEIENKGFEFSFGANILTGEFKWDLSGQASTNSNKVLKLYEGQDVYGLGSNLPFSDIINIAREGESLAVFWGFKEDGLDESGQIKYVDHSGDGNISTDDRVIIGNPNPDMIYGINSNFSFKSFDLNIFIEGVQGNDILYNAEGWLGRSFNRGIYNQFSDLLDNAWTKENPDPQAYYPEINSSSIYRYSDRFIYDGSYLRVKNVRLAYNFSALKINWLNSAQIYLSAKNLLTITDYPGYDPEVNTRGTDEGTAESRLRFGFDEMAYPNARAYTLGIKFGF